MWESHHTIGIPYDSKNAENALNENGEPLRLEEGIEAIAVQLVRFDRYERRAFSRRKWAMRDFDEDLPSTIRASGGAPLACRCR